MRGTGQRMLALVLVGALLIGGAPTAQAQADAVLAAELGAAAEGEIPAGSRIALAPPPPEQSALPVAEVEAVMSRAAQAMSEGWAGKPRILAGSPELRASLALVLNRQGQQAWRETVEATVRREAEFVLVGETGLAGGEVTLRLTLVDLSDGRVIVKTSDVPISAAAHQTAGDPRAAIGAAVRQFLDLIPEARDVVTVGAFVNESSGLETAVGRGLADMAVEAWLDAANSVTAMLRDAPPARVLRGEPPAIGFYLSGTVRLIDRDRFQLILQLWQDRALTATRTLDLSALMMPPQLRDLLDPVARPAWDGLAGVERAIRALGEARMEMAARGGWDGVYPACRATDPGRLVTDCADSLIQLQVISDRGGELMCFSLDENGLFYVMLPADYAPRTLVAPRQALSLPDDLPLLPDGNRVYWPAMGPPSETLVGCLLYSRVPHRLMSALAGLDGQALPPARIGELQSILRDSAPQAAAAVRVRIVD